MAMFGYFNNPVRYDENGNIINTNNSQSYQNQQSQTVMPEKKQSFFGEGGIGRSIAGYIGDALLASAGQKPIYAPTMMARRENADAMTKAMALEKLKAQYRSPTAAQQNYQYYQNLPAEQQKTFMDFVRQQNPYTMIGGQPYQEQPARAMYNGRTIVVRNGQWVDEATGQPVQ